MPSPFTRRDRVECSSEPSWSTALVVNEYFELDARHDHGAILELFADDAVVVNGPDDEGRDAILQLTRRRGVSARTAIAPSASSASRSEAVRATDATR